MQYSSMNSLSPFYQDSADGVFRSGMEILSGGDKNSNRASPTKLQKSSPSCGYKQIKLQKEGQNQKQLLRRKRPEPETVNKIQKTNNPIVESAPQKIIKPITILSDNGIINKNVSTSNMNDEKLQDFEKKYQHDGPIEIPNPNAQMEFPQYQNQSSGYMNNGPMMPSPLYNSALQAFFSNDPNSMKSPDDFTLNQNQKMFMGMNTENYIMGSNNLDMKNNSALLLQEKFRLYMRYFRENFLIKRQLARVESQKKQLLDQITQLQNRSSNDSIQESDKEGNNKDQRRKRHRRNANQIIRNFVCPLNDCDRMYGTEPSLLQHIKLKHNKQFKKYDNNLKKMYAAYGKKVEES